MDGAEQAASRVLIELAIHQYVYFKVSQGIGGNTLDIVHIAFSFKCKNTQHINSVGEESLHT